MKTFLRVLAHALIGGVAVGLASIPAGAPITLKTVGLPVLASAITSVFSLFSQPPHQP